MEELTMINAIFYALAFIGAWTVAILFGTFIICVVLRIDTRDNDARR